MELIIAGAAFLVFVFAIYTYVSKESPEEIRPLKAQGVDDGEITQKLFDLTRRIELLEKKDPVPQNLKVEPIQVMIVEKPESPPKLPTLPHSLLKRAGIGKGKKALIK